MIKRIALAVIAIIVLVGLLYSSQMLKKSSVISGMVEADQIRLGSLVGGRVKEVLVEEGNHVEKEETLVRLEPFELYERLAEAKAVLAAKQAERDKLEAGFRKEEIDQARQRFEQAEAAYKLLEQGPRYQEIKAARARLEAAKAQLEFARQSHKRAVKLFKDGSFPKTRYDEAVEQLQKAESNFQVKDNELAILLEGTRTEDIDAARAKQAEAKSAWALLEQGYRQEDKAAAKAAVQAAQATLAAVQKRIDELEIKAPCDGVIQSIDLEPGDLVRPQTPVVSMLNTQQRWIRAYVPEGIKVSVGDRLRVTADPLPGETFEAKVIFVADRAEFTPSNVQTPEERAKLVYRIKANLIDPPDALRRGLIVDVDLSEIDTTNRKTKEDPEEEIKENPRKKPNKKAKIELNIRVGPDKTKKVTVFSGQSAMDVLKLTQPVLPAADDDPWMIYPAADGGCYLLLFSEEGTKKKMASQLRASSASKLYAVVYYPTTAMKNGRIFFPRDWERAMCGDFTTLKVPVGPHKVKVATVVLGMSPDKVKSLFRPASDQWNDQSGILYDWMDENGKVLLVFSTVDYKSTMGGKMEALSEVLFRPSGKSETYYLLPRAKRGKVVPDEYKALLLGKNQER